MSTLEELENYFKYNNPKAIDFKNLAFSYYYDAKKLSETYNPNELSNDKKISPFPIYFLISHSLELYFKCHILFNNVLDIKDEKFKNHNLETLSNYANIKYADKFSYLPRMLNQYIYPDKEHNHLFRYPALKEGLLPSVPICLEFLEHLDNIILT